MMTHSIMILRIAKLSMMTLIILALIILTLRIAKVSIMTLRIAKLSTITLRTAKLTTMTHHFDTHHNSKNYYSEARSKFSTLYTVASCQM